MSQLMKIEKGVFYVLDLGAEKFVTASEEEAIAQLREKAGAVDDPDQIKLLLVDVTQEKWSIAQMSWAKIAVKLLGIRKTPSEKPAPAAGVKNPQRR